jgi:hypothetical protein
MKNLLGEPRKGIHKARIPGTDISLVDTVATIIGAYFISKHFHSSFVYTLLILFILGEILHVLFCVETPISKKLFNV